MRLKSFEIYLSELVDKMGQGTLADKLETDSSTLSRFRSGQGTISLKTIEKALTLGDAVIVSRGRLRRVEDALEVVSDLWKQARRSNGTGKTRISDGEK